MKGTETHGHIKVPTLLSLRDLAIYHGFVIEKSAGTGFHPFSPPLSDALAKFFKYWAVYIIVKLRKK